MNTCKQCGNPVESKAGKRKKEFCNVNCRNKFFYAQRKKLVQLGKKHLIPLPESYVPLQNIGVLKTDGSLEPIFKKEKKKVKEGAENSLKNDIESKEPPEGIFDGKRLDKTFIDELSFVSPVINLKDLTKE